MERNGKTQEDAREEDERAFDSSGDEEAKRFNEALDDGGIYFSAHGQGTVDSENDIDAEQGEYRDPELCDPEQETLPPGEMELIFENSYIM